MDVSMSPMLVSAEKPEIDVSSAFVININIIASTIQGGKDVGQGGRSEVSNTQIIIHGRQSRKIREFRNPFTDGRGSR